MTSSAALEKDLIVKCVAEHHSNHDSDQTALSTSLTKDSDVILSRPQGRSVRYPIAMSHLADGSSLSLSSSIQALTIPDIFSLLETRLIEMQTMALTPASRATVLSATDEGIDAARHLTDTLISRRNALAPISTLPPELLARIFRFHALVEPPWPSMQSLGWIRVTHVCREWRQVALDDSSLWATMTGLCPSAAWISESLVRARNAPLVIDFEFTPSLKILSKFTPHIFHIRELRLRNLSPLHYQGVQEICASEAPVLEHFELSLDLAFYPVTFPTFRELGGTTLFNGCTPKLRTLSLSQVSIPWSLIPHRQLTQLTITLFEELSTVDTSPTVNSNQLIDLLINSPELEGLVLDFCLPFMLSQVTHEQPIHLPRLSRLRLAGSTFNVTNMLGILRLPSSATLDLHCCISEEHFTYPDHPVLPLVSAHFHDPAPVEFNDFRVTIDRSECLIYVAASTSHPNSMLYDSHVMEGDIENEAELILSFHWHEWTEFDHLNQADILGRLCNMLSISNLKFLSISIPDPVCPIDWPELFQHCKKITTIQAKGPGTSGLLQSLAPPKSTNATSGRGGKGRERDNKKTQTHAINSATSAHAAPSPFPKLRTLLLEDLQFGGVLPHFSVMYNVLAHTLRRRKESETPLRKLCFHHCVISTRQANCLRRLVRDLRLDWEEASLDYEG